MHTHVYDVLGREDATASETASLSSPVKLSSQSGREMNNYKTGGKWALA